MNPSRELYPRVANGIGSGYIRFSRGFLFPVSVRITAISLLPAILAPPALSGPTVAPTITAITNNTNGVWINGVFYPEHLVKSDYRVVWSAGFSTNGVKHYVLQESCSPSFSTTSGVWYLGGEYLQTRTYQFYLKTNSTYYYRIAVTDSNEETSAWSPIVSKTVNMTPPYPPSTPTIISLARNIREDVWIGGVLHTGYVHQADFIVHVSTSSSGEGVNFYEIQETQNPALFAYEEHPGITCYLPHYPDPTHEYSNAVQQFYLKTNGTYYYRVRAVDVNGFRSAWSPAHPGPYSNIVVSMPAPYPPTTPRITAISNNIHKMVFSNGTLVAYTTAGDYMLHISTATSGVGVNVYEIQETQDPAWFHYLDTHPFPASWFNNPTAPVAVYAPHFPDAEHPDMDHPVYQFFLKTNGTYYYRVRAKDLNGFVSAWDTPYDPAHPDAYAHITVSTPEPTPPEAPVLSSNGIQYLDGDVFLTFPPAAAGGRVNVYEIQLSTDPGFSVTNEVHYWPYPHFTFRRLPEGTYYVRARTEDWNGFKSGWSETVSFTVDWPAITDLRVEQVGTNTARVTWKTDRPVYGRVERRGMFRVFDTWRDPEERIQAVNYAPAEVYGASITTNDVRLDLEELRSNNVNVINLYNLGWSELQRDGNVERFIFEKARQLGMKIVIRLEAYNKYHDWLPTGGDNVPSKHFAYREEDADWVLNYYTSNAHVFGAGGYAEDFGDVIAYYLINLPFDDTDLIRQDGIGLSDFPTREQQRRYVSYLYRRLKELDPDRPVFVNVFYGGTDNLPHFELADIVDGISVVAYPERVDGFYRSYAYVPGGEDPDYLLIMKDVMEYHLDKHSAVNALAQLRKPLVIDQTGFCEVNNAETGRVQDKRAKARAIRRLASFFESNSVADRGWTYFKVHNKFDASGEWATWGLVDSINFYLDYFREPRDGWTNAVGTWTVSNGTCRSSGSPCDVLLLDLGQKQGGLEAEFRGGTTGQTNFFLIFAWADSQHYRYAGYDGSSAQWVLGEVHDGVDTVVASAPASRLPVCAESNYTIRVLVNLNAVRLDVGLCRRLVEYEFDRPLLGRVGLLARNAGVSVNGFKLYGQIVEPTPTTNHVFVLNELYPGTAYRVRACAGGAVSGYTNFVTAADTQDPRPWITVTRPAYGNELATGTSYVIEWVASDPHGDARIDLYYDPQEKAQVDAGRKPEDQDFKGILIASDLAATNGVGRYEWNLTGVPQGSYYLCARIRRPGQGASEFDYSSGKLVLSPVQVPALRTAIAPVLDGALTDAVWSTVPATTYAVAAATGARAAVKLLWDDVYLYVGFDVDDPALRHGLGLWDSDGVGCFIHNGRASLNKVDIRGNTHVEYVGANSNEVNWGGTGIALATNAHGYQVEMRFKWTSLRTIPQRLGIVPCDFLLVDRDAAGAITNLSWDGVAADKVAGRSLRLVNSLVEFDEKRLRVVIGEDDNDHHEFAQEGSAYQAYYYPGVTPLTNFPRELNVNWWRDQYIVLDVDYHSAANGLLATFDIMAAADSRAFQMRVDVENALGSNTIATVALSLTNKTYLVIPGEALNVGVNTLHLHGDSGATWVLWDQITIAPCPYTLHLYYTNGIDYFPAAVAERSNYTGAACAWMITRYLKGSSFTQTQEQIYGATQHDPAHNGEITPSSCAQWMQAQSWPPYWFAALSRTNVRAALREIVFWMDYIPPGGQKTPAYLVCGTNWSYKVARGFQTDKKPYQGGFWPGETTELYTVYGMWLNDPAVSGLGFNTYATGAELENLWEPSTASGAYWFLVDPACDPLSAAQAHAQIERMEVALAPGEASPELARYFSSLRAAGGKLNCNPLRPKDLGAPPPHLLRVIPYPLLQDEGFMTCLAEACDTRSYLVNEGQPDEYGLIAGGLRGPASTVYVLMLDSRRGALRRATWNAATQRFPLVSREAALWVARQRLGTNAPLLTCRLLYSPYVDPSPFLPRWELLFDLGGNTATVTVSQLTDLSGDSDGDGMSDGQELYAGMDPEDPASCFAAAGRATAAVPGGGLELCWPSVTGLEYSIYRAPSLSDPFTLIAHDIPATPPINVYTDAPPWPAAFYRISAE